MWVSRQGLSEQSGHRCVGRRGRQAARLCCRPLRHVCSRAGAAQLAVAPSLEPALSERRGTSGACARQRECSRLQMRGGGGGHVMSGRPRPCMLHSHALLACTAGHTLAQLDCSASLLCWTADRSTRAGSQPNRMHPPACTHAPRESCLLLGVPRFGCECASHAVDGHCLCERDVHHGVPPARGCSDVHGHAQLGDCNKLTLWHTIARCGHGGRPSAIIIP